MAQVRKKPAMVEAVLFTGRNYEELEKFVGGDAGISDGRIVIATLEGAMTVSVGDWIIRGVKGEFYPCKPDIFTATYEPVTEPKP